jgi:hypothetical protein
MIKNEIIQTVVINAVIVQNREQFKNTTQNDTLATIRSLFEKHQSDINASSTKFFQYASYTENIHLNVTETTANLSSIIGNILHK